MPHRTLDYPEVAGKVVEEVTFTCEEDFHFITISFTDKTALGFHIKMRMEAKPELMDWTTGDGKPLKQYKKVKERPWEPL